MRSKFLFLTLATVLGLILGSSVAQAEISVSVGVNQPAFPQYYSPYVYVGPPVVYHYVEPPPPPPRYGWGAPPPPRRHYGPRPMPHYREFNGPGPRPGGRPSMGPNRRPNGPKGPHGGDMRPPRGRY